MPVEFPPNKLKQGAGEHAVYVLDNLADRAIAAEKFKWKKYKFYYLFYFVKCDNYKCEFSKIWNKLKYLNV